MRNSCLALLLVCTMLRVAPAQDLDRPVSELPAPSPDGARIAFTSNATGVLNIWTANLDGTRAKPLLPSAFVQREPDWSPNGVHLVYSSRQSGKFNIWQVAADGTAATQLTSDGNNRQPRYSADGQWIVFVSDRTGKRELWYMKADGSNQKAVGLQSLLVSDPDWSTDGKSIVYVGCTRPPNGASLLDAACHLFVIAVDASVTRQLTNGKVIDSNPDWGPNGILFSSIRDSTQGLWLINPDGSGLRQLTNTPNALELHPRWDSFGNILFARGGGAFNIWSLDAAGSAQQVTLVNGFTAAGDVDVNGRTDCQDLVAVRSSLGSKRGEARFDGRADVNLDGIIDVRDLSSVSQKLPRGTVCR